jgi:hypothetical protein
MAANVMAMVTKRAMAPVREGDVVDGKSNGGQQLRGRWQGRGREEVWRRGLWWRAMKRAIEMAARAMATATKRARARVARGMATATKRARARAARGMAMATRVVGD